MMQGPLSIMVVDDDPSVRKSLTGMLKLEGFKATGVESAEGALEGLRNEKFHVVLADIYLPGVNGIELLAQIKEQYPEMTVILMTGFGRIDDAVEGTRQGAYEYLVKPIDDEALKRLLNRSQQTREIRDEIAERDAPQGDGAAFGSLVGHDPKMREIFDLVTTVAQTEATCLIAGESGTGKSTVARAIHARSRRSNAPLVEISCGALAANLLESELFGHVRGAFTGAVANKVGKFELAKGGTIFLDEIDTLELSLQVKLLRVLQERRFEQVGGVETRTADVRVIAAANQDLQACIANGTFRQDLYYRLNVISLTLPPLRDRPGDIPALAQHFLQAFCRANHKQVHDFTEDAIRALVEYSWPGNIRELENAVERAVILAPGDHATADHLPDNLSGAVASAHEPQIETGTPGPLKASLEVAERGILVRALDANRWNRQATAAMLDINRTTLFHKMKKFDLLQRGGHAAPTSAAGPLSSSL